MADMRLIDANALLRKTMKVETSIEVDGRKRTFSFDKIVVPADEIEKAPTIEAEPVMHGRWVYGVTLNHEWRKCSVCLVSQDIFGCFTYCPNCGAKMDGQDTNVPTKSDRGCSTCANDGHDMPQCRECTEHPGYPWYKRKDGGAE